MSPNEPRRPRDVSRSIHDRLINLARARGVSFNVVLQRYAAERFLYRLSASPVVDRFTLKGAALLRVWAGQELRATRDLDLLGSGTGRRATLRADIESVCAVSCPEDGVAFDAATLRVDDIRGEQLYGGLRVRLFGRLGQARLPLQVDIGFGDAITPEREERDYPTLLDLPAPRLWTYPRETAVAEKLEAMVSLGATNSRVKDLWDVALLARLFDFDGETLRSAIEATFQRRGTELGSERPEALGPAYYEDTMRAQRWQELLRQVEPGGDGPARLSDAGQELRRFLGPVYNSLLEGTPCMQVWPAGGDWKPGGYGRGGGKDD